MASACREAPPKFPSHSSGRQAGFTLDLGTHTPAAIPVTLGLLAQPAVTAKSQQLAQLPAWEERVARTMAADRKAHLLLRHPRARIPSQEAPWFQAHSWLQDTGLSGPTWWFSLCRAT